MSYNIRMVLRLQMTNSTWMLSALTLAVHKAERMIQVATRNSLYLAVESMVSCNSMHGCSSLSSSSSSSSWSPLSSVFILTINNIYIHINVNVILLFYSYVFFFFIVFITQKIRHRTLRNYSLFPRLYYILHVWDLWPDGLWWFWQPCEWLLTYCTLWDLDIQCGVIKRAWKSPELAEVARWENMRKLSL